MPELEPRLPHIYIIHALSGYEAHKERLQKLLRAYAFEFEFVTDGDASKFTTELLSPYFVDDVQNIVNKGALSCTLNHFLAYEKIRDADDPFAIILENDPYFLGNFEFGISQLLPGLAQLPPGFIVSLENTTLEFPSYSQKRRGGALVRARRGRMAGAYIIDRVGAAATLDAMGEKKCSKVIDHWHNDLIDRGVIKMYWASNPLVEQGSHNGKMSSTISTKPSNALRRLRWQLQKFYKSKIRTLFDSDLVIE